MEDIRSGRVVRRYFAFALRDVLPLDERGWTLHTHTVECDAPPCADLATCRGVHAQLIQKPAEDSGLTDALASLSDIVKTLTDEVGGERGPAIPAFPMGFSSFAIASAPVDEHEDGDTQRDTFESAFELLRRAVDALRHVTWSRVPSLTIERIWPTYFILQQQQTGPPAFVELGKVAHGTIARTTRPATAVELDRAQSFLVASYNGDPVENFRYHHLAAHNAGLVEGDYDGAILKAAAAAEILLKHTAATLIWEASQQRGGAPPWSTQIQPLDARPSTLIARVLAPALKGSWSSKYTHQPIGAWRYHIAQVRNEVIHGGHRPSADQVNAALAALEALVSHLNDRLAARASTYPRTAVLIAGEFGLQKRGAWGKVRAAVASASVEEWRRDYRLWLEETNTSDPLIDDD